MAKKSKIAKSQRPPNIGCSNIIGVTCAAGLVPIYVSLAYAGFVSEKQPFAVRFPE